MALYLNERQVGYDTTIIGFPSLGDCMGLVVQDNAGLFGFHLTRGDANLCAEFVSYVLNHIGYRGAMLHLFGSCNFRNRYNGGARAVQWQQEMTAIAQAITFHGPVSGCDLSHKTSIKHGEATYIEYRLGGHGVTMHYKRMSKMTDTTLRGGGAIAPDGNIRMIDKDRGRMNVLNAPGATTYQEVYHLTNVLRLGYTTDVTLNVTERNKGRLHSAKGSGIHTFDAP